MKPKGVSVAYFGTTKLILLLIRWESSLKQGFYYFRKIHEYCL